MCGDLLRWFCSYLRNRSQAVAIKGHCSAFLPVSSGVPQGSHLGPLLFNIFVNDIITCFHHSKILLFADDMKIFRSIKTINDCNLLQEDLCRLISYCDDNHLYLNINKCNIITFTRKKDPIIFNYKLENNLVTRQSVIRDLGVYLDDRLLFTSHINLMAQKAYKMLGFVLRISKDFKRAETLITLFNALVRSILEYCSACWNPQYKVYTRRIECLYHKFLRHLKQRHSNAEPLIKTLKDISLEKRRDLRDQVLLYKLVNNMIDSPLLVSKLNFACHRLGARTKPLFAVPKFKTKYASNNFVSRACKNFNVKHNNLDLFNVKFNNFKDCLRKLL